MPNPRLRIDQLPMHRRASAHGAGEGVAYERREVDPDSEELARRTGSTRQAQYAQALGFVAEQEGARVVIDNEFDLTGTWSIGFSANVGDILDTTASEYWTLLFAGSTAVTDTKRSIHCFLERSGSDYRVNLTSTTDGGVTQSVTINVTPGADHNFLITRSGTDLTLNVSGKTPQTISLSGVYSVSETQIELLGSYKATAKGNGTAPVLDNFHIFEGEVVSDTVYGVRTPSGSDFSIQPSDIGGTAFSPASASYNVYLHPSPPEILSSKLHFTGFGGAVRVPFRSVFERYFQTETEIADSKTFTFRVKGQRKFLSANSTLIDFGGDETGDLPLAYLKLVNGVPTFTYGSASATSTVTISEGADFEILCGVDGTNAFIKCNTEAVQTDSLDGEQTPFLSFERIPDLYIGNDEDPSEGKAFHGYLDTVQFFDYAAKVITTTSPSPVLDLDMSGEILRDGGVNRLALESIAHASTESPPLYAPGPLTDQSFQAVQQEVVLGPSAVGYTGKYAAPITSDAAGVRAGDRAYIHSGDYVHVLNSELSQVRPLGIPEPETLASCIAVDGAGRLDGIYSYGYRFRSQDGTYGPMKRLKPVKALQNSSVLIGSTQSDSGETNLGVSYLKTDTSTGAAEFMSLTDDGGSGGDFFNAVSDGDELSFEVYANVQDFNKIDEDESVFEHGVGRFSVGSGEERLTLCRPHSETNKNGVLDVRDDWTIQVSFKFHDVAGTRQGIMGLCSDKIRSSNDSHRIDFGLFIDSTTHKWTSSADPRMVCVIANGKETGQMRYLIFNDTNNEGTDAGLWEDGYNYTVVAARKGDALTVSVCKQTAESGTDGTWTKLSGGKCDTFFQGDRFNGNKTIENKVKSPQYFHIKTREKAKNSSGSSNHYSGVALRTASASLSWTRGSGATSSGSVDTQDVKTDSARNSIEVRHLQRNSILYHARAWDIAVPHSKLVDEANKRWAVVDGLYRDRCVSDVMCASTSLHYPQGVWDRIRGFWHYLSAEDWDNGRNTQDYPPYSEERSVYPFAVLAADNDTLSTAPFIVYASTFGGGSIHAGVGFTDKPMGGTKHMILRRAWGDNIPNADFKTFELLRDPVTGAEFDLENFHFYTSTLVVQKSGNNLNFSVKDFSIDGNLINDNPKEHDDAKDIDTSSRNLELFVGGIQGTNNGREVRVGEVRLWNQNRYDDPSEEYDYLTTRVASSEFSNLYIYGKFQPNDSTVNFGSANAGLGADTFVQNNGEIVTASNESDGSNMPSLGLPDPPYPWITAIDLFRTTAFPIEDEENQSEVDRALSLVEGQPAYFLARISAGDNSFIDIVGDDSLGFEAPEGGEGFSVEKPNGVCIWQNQLALFRGNTLYFSERGPFGWESFPSWASYAVPTSGSGSDIVGAVEIGSSLLVCGKSWATMLSGAPSQPRPFDLGPGTGAQSARCIAVHGGIAYALGDGKLWRVGQDGGYDDQFSQPVHDILPTQGRVAVVGALSSLLVIDEQSDQVLRFHFPTQAWSIEERDALGVGDQGSDYFVVHQGGSYSKGSAVYGDDVAANTVATSVNATKGSSTTLTNVTTDPNIVAGTRILVVDTTGTEVTARVESYAGSTLTVDGDLSSLSDTAQACTIYYGVGQTGMMVDTGWFAVGSRNSDLSLFTDVTSGSFDYSLAGTDTPGDRSNRTGLSFTDLGTAYESTGTGGRGRYVRAVVRNRTAQSASLGHAEVEVKVEQQAS